MTFVKKFLKLIITEIKINWFACIVQALLLGVVLIESTFSRLKRNDIDSYGISHV